MKATFIVGVMGGADVHRQDVNEAYQLGKLIAGQGWVLLNGGRRAGVMDASAQGASENGGLTIGVLPGEDRTDASPHIRIPVCTGMGSARNAINVLSSDVVVACRGGAGTLSEIALALKHGKQVIIVGDEQNMPVPEQLPRHRLTYVKTVEKAIEHILQLFFPHRM